MDNFIGYQAGDLPVLEESIAGGLGLLQHTGMPSNLIITVADTHVTEYVIINGYKYEASALAGNAPTVTGAVTFTAGHGVSTTTVANSLAAVINATDSTLYAYNLAAVVYVETKVAMATDITYDITTYMTTHAWTCVTCEGELAGSVKVASVVHTMTSEDATNNALKLTIPLNNIKTFYSQLRDADTNRVLLVDDITIATSGGVVPGEVTITTSGVQTTADTVTVGDKTYQFRAADAAVTDSTYIKVVLAGVQATDFVSLYYAIKTTQPSLEVERTSATVITLRRKDPSGAVVAVSESAANIALSPVTPTAIRNTLVTVTEGTTTEFVAGDKLAMLFIGY